MWSRFLKIVRLSIWLVLLAAPSFSFMACNDDPILGAFVPEPTDGPDDGGDDPSADK